MVKHVSHQLHPASEMKDTLYPMGEHLNKERRHSIYYQRTIYSFNQLAFGGVVNLQFNNTDLISDCMLEATFPAGTLRSLPMVRLINRIEVIVAGAQPYILNGNDIWNFTYDSAESNSKRDQLIQLAGGNGGVKASSVTYYLPLGHLPWSKIQVTDKIPFDSTLCGQIKIYIYLNAVANVYSSGTPSALDSGKMYVRSAVVQDPEDKIVLKQDEALNYPFVFCQSFVSPQFTPASTTQQQNVYLLGFRSGACTGMLLRNVDVSNQLNAGQALNTMSNIIISLNGQILFKLDNDSAKAWDLFQNKCATNWNYDGSNDYWYVSIPFSQTPAKNKDYGLEYQHGLQLANQQVLLQFTSSSTNAQVVEATYLFNGNLIVANGNAEIVV